MEEEPETESQLANRKPPPEQSGIWLRFEVRVGASREALEKLGDTVTGVKAIIEEAKPWLPIVLPLLALLTHLLAVGLGPLVS